MFQARTSAVASLAALTLLLTACGQKEREPATSLNPIEAPAGRPGDDETDREDPPTGEEEPGTPEPEPEPPPSYARDWVVSPDGDDAGEGTLASPLRTIRSALGKVAPGERILVKPGHYDEALKIDGSVAAGTAEAPIVLEGEGMPRLTSSDGGWIMVQLSRPHWRVEGFELDAQGQGKYAVAFSGSVEGSAIRGNDIHSGSHGGGVTTFGGASDALIEGNRIHDFWRNGDDSHGVVVQPTSRDITIRDNVIWGNSGDSVQCWGPEGYSNDPPADGVLIEGNDLYGSFEQAIDIKTCFNVTIRGNALHGFRRDAVHGGDAAMVVHLSPRNVLIEDNEFYDSGLAIAVGGTTYGDSPRNVVIRRNVIRDMITEGGMTGGGVLVLNVDGLEVTHNTFTGLQGPAFILGIGAKASNDLTIKNNLVDADSAFSLGSRLGALTLGTNHYRSGASFAGQGFEDWQSSRADTGSRADGPTLDPETLQPGASSLGWAEDLGDVYCGSGPDVGALEGDC